MLRSVLVVLGGFLAASMVVAIGTTIAVAVMLPAPGPGAMPEPTSAYLAVNLALSFLAAVFGGWLAARLARRAPLGHAMGVGSILLVLAVGVAALSSDGTQGSQPGWYLYVVGLLGWVGATLGGLTRRPRPAP